MTDIRDLYQRTILDHGRSPRNFRTLEGDAATAELHNVACGDRLVVAVAVADDAIRDIAFQGAGCAISVASASMMTEAAAGLSPAEACQLADRFTDLVSHLDEPDPSRPPMESPSPRLAQLSAFRAVARFPVRIACATLAWRALRAALERRA